MNQLKHVLKEFVWLMPQNMIKYTTYIYNDRQFIVYLFKDNMIFN